MAMKPVSGSGPTLNPHASCVNPLIQVNPLGHIIMSITRLDLEGPVAIIKMDEISLKADQVFSA